jgi:hypothetical protein
MIHFLLQNIPVVIDIVEDEILVRTFITNSDGSIVEDTRSTADDGDFIISGDMFSKNADYYYMFYAGRDADCGQWVRYFYVPKALPNLKISLQQANLFEDISQKCPAGRAVQLIPLEGMMLTSSKNPK